jgi:hypothetical protein
MTSLTRQSSDVSTLDFVRFTAAGDRRGRLAVTATTPDPDSASDRIDARIKSSRYNRRALLLGAAGVGVVATVAGADPAHAANGDPVSLGSVNTANDTTSITTGTGNGLQASTLANGQSGIYGNETSPTGGNGV